MPDYDPDFDFKGNADRLLLGLRMIAESVDVEQMLAVISHADAMGPFIDPTKYRDALQRGDLHNMRALCNAVLPALKVWDERIAPHIPVSA